MLVENMLSPIAFLYFYAITYSKTPGFFFRLIFLVSSPPSTTTSGFPHSSLMSNSTSVNLLSFQFHLNVSYGYSSTVTIFFRRVVFFFFENKTRNIKKINIWERIVFSILLHVYLRFFSPVEKSVNRVNQIR